MLVYQRVDGFYIHNVSHVSVGSPALFVKSSPIAPKPNFTTFGMAWGPGLCCSSSLCLYLSIHPSIHLSIHLSKSVYIYIYLSTSISVSIYLSIYMSVCLSVHLSVCLSIYPSIYLAIHLSMCLYVFLHVSILSTTSPKTRSRRTVADAAAMWQGRQKLQGLGLQKDKTLLIYPWKMLIFHGYVNVYQRVSWTYGK